MIEIPTDTGPLPIFVARPDGDGPWPAVVVLHDVYGMTTDVKNQARWLASEGYLAAAPDLYRGARTVGCMVRTLGDLMRGRDGEVVAHIAATRQWLLADACTGRVGVIGFCMGGGFALMVAPKGLFDVAAPNYGPLSPAAAAGLGGACPIVASYGAKDPMLPGEAARLERHLSAHGVPHDIHVYPDAAHGFLHDHVPDELPWLFLRVGGLAGTRHHAPSAAHARGRILVFFERYLREAP